MLRRKGVSGTALTRRSENLPELFIGGSWRSALDERTREIRCPADGSLVGVVDEAAAKDAVEAIAAALHAFDRPMAGYTGRMTVVQEQSFGPVLTVERFTDEAEAVRLANDTVYGLAGSVFTTDEAKAQRVAARLRIGTVWINDYHPYVPQAEWGGYKQSGFGRELGPSALAEYREAKHIWRNTDPSPQGWFS